MFSFSPPGIAHSYVNKQRLIPRFTVAICCALIASALTFAQGTRGTISGKVTDPNGAVIANASVKLIDIAKQQELRTVQTNAEGVYQFLEVEPATYNVVISASGFNEIRLSGVKVEPNRNLQLDATLNVGGAIADVTVTATQELVDRETPTLGTTVDPRRVVGLPLNGRNVLDLALLQPGVTPSNNNTTSTFGQGTGIRVNGQRGVENNVQLDGSNNNEIATGGEIGANPRPDALQEFRLLTSNFEAEFGRNTGAVINLVAKSGTNDYHGNARIFYRPTFLSAARFFDQDLPSSKPRRHVDQCPPNCDFRRPFERKEIGGQFGGPIKLPRFGEGGPAVYSGKNRSFFFVDYERRAQLIGATQTITSLPTAEERAGIFTDRFNPTTRLPILLLDPATRAPFPVISGSPTTRNSIVKQQVPTSRFSPIALFYLNFMPVPDASGTASAGANDITNNHYFTSRVDHILNQKQNVNVTFNFFNLNETNPFAFGGSTIPGFGEVDQQRTFNVAARHTYTISPNLVNSLLLGYARNNFPAVAPQNLTSPAQIGFQANFVANQQFAGPPRISFLSRGFNIGNTIQGPQARVVENFQIQDSVSWAKGDHRFKFGFDGTKYRQNQLFLFVNQGILNFSRLTGPNTTGDDLLDFLLGSTPSSEQFGANGRRDYRQMALAGFAQDTWRVTDTFTLSLGLRYEYNSPLTDKFNRVAYFRQGAVSQLLTTGQLKSFEGLPITVPAGRRAPVGLVFVGDPDPVLGGTVPPGGMAKDLNNFAPRVGFAYSPKVSSGWLGTLLGTNRQSVIRAGFGVFYGAIVGDTALQQLSAPGFNGTNSFFSPACGTLANPFGPDPFPGFRGKTCTPVPNPFAQNQLNIFAPLTQFSRPIDPHIRTPYTYQYNLTLERGFLTNYVASISYVGNRGRKLYALQQVNPAVGTFIPVPSGRTIPAPTPNNYSQRRLDPDILIGLSQLVTNGNSWYNALELNLQRRYANGLLFQVAYTYSKSMNDSDNSRSVLDLLNTRIGKALSDDDIPHRFVGSLIYDLPFFKHSNGFIKTALGGWSLGGIVTIQSGTPFSVLNPNDEVGTEGIISYADFGAPFQLLDPRRNDRQAFNANAFVAFADPSDPNFVLGRDFRRGTSGRNQFRLANGIHNFDFILSKRTQLWKEGKILELRFEAFNAFNHTQFTTIDNNLLSPTFGKYTAARESRVIQLGARFSF